MGSFFSISGKIQPQEFENVARFHRSISNENEAVNPKNRKCTDVFFLILMSSFFIILAFLLGYCVFHGNLYRLLNGYDNCADICGVQNYGEKEERFKCKGKDRRKDPYLLIENAGGAFVNASSISRKCVSNCSLYEGYRQFLNRCVPEKSADVVNSFFSKLGMANFFEEAAEDLFLCWNEIIYLSLTGLAFSIILMVLLRYFVGVLVWVVLMGVILTSTAGTIYLWILYKTSADTALVVAESDSENRKRWSFLLFAIAASIATACIILVIIVLRKRIKLVVRLFVEAGKAIASMPLLLLQPILTFVCLSLVIASWIYFCLWIQSAGFLTYIRMNFFSFEPDSIIKLARWWNLFSMLWMTQFIIGCQHMVIAGAVATWYFTRDKNKLGDPILYSIYNLTKYHLGSVCLGSLLIALIQLMRIILAAIQKYFKSKENQCSRCVLKCCQCCLYCFEKILKYLSRNAYIEIAMYGYNFCQAGKQAFKLLVANSLRVTVINSVGDFVLFLGKVLVVLATVLIGVEILQKKEGLQHIWVPLLLVGAFTYFVSHCFLTVYEMVIDTIFLCFCEDCEQNDGLNKPYFMSRGLMKFVENSKKALENLGRNDPTTQVWGRNMSTISDTVQI